MEDMKRVNLMIQWIALTTVGLAGGLIAGLMLGMPVGQIANAMITTAFVTCLAGAILGGSQAFGLRRLMAKPMWWTLATTIGIGLGLAAGVVLVEQVGILMTGNRPNVAQLSTVARATSFIALGFLAGTILGAAQWLVLRSQIPEVKWWILSSGVALAVAFSASSLLLDLIGLRFASATGAIAFVLMSGAAFGAITSWPLRHAI
jgi:hypothetical protein